MGARVYAAGARVYARSYEWEPESMLPEPESMLSCENRVSQSPWNLDFGLGLDNKRDFGISEGLIKTFSVTVTRTTKGYEFL